MSIRKLSRMLLFINGMQFLLGAALMLALQLDLIAYSESLLDISIFLILLSSIVSFGGMISATRYQKMIYEESIRNLEDFNTKLREQRHDYLNQIQIVHGLLELDEFEEAKNYLQPVFRDIMKVNRALKTSQPAVNALLRAKMEAAEQQGVDLYVEIGTQLNRLPLEPWEFCKILANLIDNAVTAAGQNEGEKRVFLRLQETPLEYRGSVQNNGPEIPETQQKLILGKGYTTKTGEGHGMGLHIVSSVLKQAGGNIRVTSSPEETVFFFTLPKAVSSGSKNDRLRAKLYK